MKEEKRKEVQICYLNQEERHNPSGVIRAFTEDIALDAVRKLIVTLRTIANVTDNVPYGSPEAREDLFFMTDRIIRLFEAFYLQQSRLKYQMEMYCTNIRKLKVFDKPVARNIKGVPNNVPCISLFGKWLTLLGFTPGTAITVISEKGKIFITTNTDWEENATDTEQRA